MQKLLVHPSAHQSADSLAVFASAELNGSLLRLKYKIDESIVPNSVKWPLKNEIVKVLGADDRRDELWKSTCLEAFLITLDGSYYEFNFSPDGFWNVYHFNSYRTGMRKEDRLREVGFKSSQGRLSADLELSNLLKSPQHFRLGLTAVIETKGGERSYWSLKHSGEKPDFHDSQSYVLEMRI